MKTILLVVGILVFVFVILNIIGGAIFTAIQDDITYIDALNQCVLVSLSIGGQTPVETTGAKWFFIFFSTISVTFYLTALMVGVKTFMK